MQLTYLVLNAQSRDLSYLRAKMGKRRRSSERASRSPQGARVQPPFDLGKLETGTPSILAAAGPELIFAREAERAPTPQSIDLSARQSRKLRELLNRYETEKRRAIRLGPAAHHVQRSPARAARRLRPIQQMDHVQSVTSKIGVIRVQRYITVTCSSGVLPLRLPQLSRSQPRNHMACSTLEMAAARSSRRSDQGT